MYRECDVVILATSLDHDDDEEEEESVDWCRPHLPLLHVLTKQDLAGSSLSLKAGIQTSAMTGYNVETVFLMCCSLATRTKVRPDSLQLRLSVSASPQQSADIRPSRLYSQNQNKSQKILPKLTPVQPPLSPATESLRWEIFHSAFSQSE